MSENQEIFESAECNELYAALAKAQGEFDEASKDANNPFFKSDYATLGEVVRVSRPALSRNGLAVTQKPVMIDGISYLITKLGHASGQWTESRALISPAKPDIQGWGSYITYLRRYCYAAICGVIIGNDDDGESDRQAHEQKPSKKQDAVATKGEIKTLEFLIEKCGDPNLRQNILNYHALDSFDTATSSLIKTIIDSLKGHQR